jgi:hypothetical protein
MRRIGLIAVAMLVGAAAAAAAAVAARDALYWEKPLPGVALRQVELDRPVEVRVADERYAVAPSSVLQVDEAATQAALVEAGHDSFLRRVRQLVDPSPPALLVDPVLVPTAGAEELARKLSQTLPRPRRAQVVARGGSFRILPSRPGDSVAPETPPGRAPAPSHRRSRTSSPS